MNNFKEILLKESVEIEKLLYNESGSEVDTSGDDTDKIQGEFLNKIHGFINNRKIYRLKEVYEALKRIDNGQFGNCEDCDEKIGIKRLEFNPCIRTCITCAELRELDQKKG